MFSSCTWMKRTLSDLTARYGRTVRRGQAEFSAFLNPVTHTSRENLRRAGCDLGEVPAGVYVYIGPLEPMLEVDDTVTADGEDFLVRRAETLLLGGTALYRWGLLTKVGSPWPEL